MILNINLLLKKYRKRAKKTQKEIAQVLNISRSTYSYYESGKILPDLKTVFKLSKIFGINYTELLVHEEKHIAADFGHKNAELSPVKTEEKMVDIFRSLNEKKKKKILELLEIFKDELPEKDSN